MFGTLTLAAFVFALGPRLVVLGHVTRIPLPYELLYTSVPGFSLMRAPARFGLFLSFGLSILACLGASSILRNVSQRLVSGRSWGRVGSASLLLGVTGIGLFHIPLHLERAVSSKDLPEVYRWLAKHPSPGVMAELPADPYDLTWQHFSAYHFRPMIQGYSGFEHPHYRTLQVRLDTAPLKELVSFLRDYGVTTIVLHEYALRKDRRLQWRAFTASRKSLAEVARFRSRFGSDVVYALAPAETPRAEKLVAKLDLPPEYPRIISPRLKLILAGENGGPWLNTHGPFARGIITWINGGTGETALLEKVGVELPWFIGAGHDVAVGLAPSHLPPSGGLVPGRL